MNSRVVTPFSDGKFVFGVDVVRIAGIDGDGEAGVGNGGSGERLRFARLGPWVVDRRCAAMAKRRQADDVEGKISLSEELSPVGDHHGKNSAVLVAARRVLLALVPQRAAIESGAMGSSIPS